MPFGEGWLVRAHAPLALGRRSRPEPDISVVRGTARDFWDHAPATAALVVEISDTSLHLDRGRKSAIYAGAGIAEYWIVNLIGMVVEIRRDPRASDRSPRGRDYRSVQTLERGAIVSPVSAPQARIPISALLG